MKTAIHPLYGHLVHPGMDGLIAEFDYNFVVTNYKLDEERDASMGQVKSMSEALMKRWNIEAVAHCFEGEENAGIMTRSGVDMSKLSPRYQPGECVPLNVHLTSFCKDLIGTFEIPGTGMIEALKRIYPEAFAGEVYGFGGDDYHQKACFEAAGCKFEWGSIARSPFVGVNN